MSLSLWDLAQITQAQLDMLFRRGTSNNVPDGRASCTAIVAGGGDIVGPVLWFARWYAWQGKVFDGLHRTVRDDVGPFGFHLMRGSVYIAPSTFDQRPAIILDYSKTSLLARKLRDEIRQIAPSTYVGIVYYDELKAVNFALAFDNIE